MRIEKVEYRKLFNLGEYEHEEICYVANVEPNETGDQVLVKLIQYAENAHKAISMLKGISGRIDRIYASWKDPYRSSMPAEAIECQEEELKREKHRLERLLKDFHQSKKVMTDESKQQYLDSITSCKENISECSQKIMDLKKEGKELLKKLERYRRMFKSGDFSFLVIE